MATGPNVHSDGFVSRLLKQVDELQARMTELVTENRALKAELAARRSEMREPWPHDRRGDVTAFFRVADQGHDIGATPHVPPERSLRLGLRLVVEEVIEILDASLSSTVLDDVGPKLMRAIENDPIVADLPALADGVIDSFYVLEGLLIRCGINGRPLWDAVHAANLTKASGPTCEKTGKRLKPTCFVPPDIEALLRAQGWKP